MNKKILVALLSLSIGTNTPLLAQQHNTNLTSQECDTYSEADRLGVKAVFLHATIFLNRLHDIGLLVATTELSYLQRTAIENEYIALKEEVERIGEEPGDGISELTQEFLDCVVDPRYLKIADTRVNSENSREAIKLAKEANIANQRALTELWSSL